MIVLYKCTVITSKCSSAISWLTSFVPHPPRGSLNVKIFVSIFQLPKIFTDSKKRVLLNFFDFSLSNLFLRHYVYTMTFADKEFRVCYKYLPVIILKRKFILRTEGTIFLSSSQANPRHCEGKVMRTAWEGSGSFGWHPPPCSVCPPRLMTRWILVNIKYKEWLLCQAFTSVTIHHRDGDLG